MICDSTKLEILIGPNPKKLNETRATAENRICGDIFDGYLTVHIADLNDVENQLKNDGKLFSIQMRGKIGPRADSRPPLSFDDVLFGIELNNPLDTSRIPIPNWLIKMLEYWIRRMDAELWLENVFGDRLGNDELGLLNKPIRGVQTDVNNGARLLLPLVCAASTMNAYIDNDQSHAVHNSYLETILLDTPVSENIQKYQREIEWSNLMNFHNSSIYQRSNFSKSFPRLVENNRFLYASKEILERANHSAEVGLFNGRKNLLQRYEYKTNKLNISKSPQERRAACRQATKSFGRTLYENITRRKTSIRQEPHLLRSSMPFHPSVTYCFDFLADYFDFRTFELRPKLWKSTDCSSQQEFHESARPPLGLARFFDGRWNMDSTKVIGETVSGPNGMNAMESEVRLVCKLRKSEEYLWCICFRLTKTI